MIEVIVFSARKKIPPLAGDLSWLMVRYRCLGCRRAGLPKAPPLLTEPFEMFGRGFSAAVLASHQAYVLGSTTTATTVRVPRRVSTRSCSYCFKPFIQDHFFTLASSQHYLGSLSPFTIVGVKSRKAWHCNASERCRTLTKTSTF